MDRPMGNKIDHELVAAANVLRNHINLLVPAWENRRITMRVNDFENVEFTWWAETDAKITRQGFTCYQRHFVMNMVTALSYV